MSHYADALTGPAVPEAGLVTRLYRSASRLVRAIVARIDLSQFPGSCCG